MSENLYKECSACKNLNSASEVMCIICGADISGEKAYTSQELKSKKEQELKIQKEKDMVAAREAEKEKIRSMTQEERLNMNRELRDDFKKAFSQGTVGKSTRKTELFPRDHTDEEAEKILADMKNDFDIFKNSAIEKAKEVFDKIKK